MGSGVALLVSTPCCVTVGNLLGFSEPSLTSGELVMGIGWGWAGEEEKSCECQSD